MAIENIYLLRQLSKPLGHALEDPEQGEARVEVAGAEGVDGVPHELPRQVRQTQDVLQQQQLGHWTRDKGPGPDTLGHHEDLQ